MGTTSSKMAQPTNAFIAAPLNSDSTMWITMTALRQLRLVALLEGTSFVVLLFIAMPLSISRVFRSLSASWEACMACSS